jgi:cell shape-determining protein MreC
MKRKRTSQSKGMLFTGGLLVGLTFLFLVPRDTAGRLQLAYARAFHWPLALGGGVVRVSRTTTQNRNVSPKEHEEVLNAYRRARNSAANLEAQLQEAQQQLARLTNLKTHLGLGHLQTIPAKIITHVQDEMTIDQGRDSGVAVGQYVLSLTNTRLNDHCVIGVVSAVHNKGAKVRLLTDPDSRLAVHLAGLDAPKWLEGRGEGTARIPLVPFSDTIGPGDVVYADPKQGALGVPVIVAEIVQCKRDADNPLVLDITVRPACDLAALRDVVVVKPRAAP